jgi:hypothetical protein
MGVLFPGSAVGQRIEAMLERDLTTADRIRELFLELEPQLFRFPAVDASTLADRVQRLAADPAARRDQDPR